MGEERQPRDMSHASMWPSEYPRLLTWAVCARGPVALAVLVACDLDLITEYVTPLGLEPAAGLHP